MEHKILNIPQLLQAIRDTKAHYVHLLTGEIRLVGLRDRIEARLDTLNKIEKLFLEHKE